MARRGRHRITATGTPGMTAQQTAGAQVGPRGSTMGFKRLQCIRRTSRLEPTSRPQPGAQHQAIKLHQPDQHLLCHGAARAHVGLLTHRGQRAAALAISAASSWLAARARRSDAALTNSWRSNGVRSRTTHSPGASAAATWDTAARMRRFNSVRVTARLACRFGTTKPSQSSVTGDSSTAGESSGIVAVDKSEASGLEADFFPDQGRCGKWCTTKCAVRARAGALSTWLKSPACVRARVTATGGTLTVRGLGSGRSLNSDSQTLATLGATSIDDGAAATGLHADQKAVGASAAGLRGLVGAFHGVSSEKIAVSPRRLGRGLDGCQTQVARRYSVRSGSRAAESRGVSRHYWRPSRWQGNLALDQETRLPSKATRHSRARCLHSETKHLRFRSVDNSHLGPPFS